MQISSIKTANRTLNYNGLLNNKLLVKGLGMASDNGVLFCAAASLGLSTLVRPLVILATPNVDKENKQYACAKSIASSIIGLGITALISAPVVCAVKNIQDNPKKFLTNKAIQTFKNGEINLKSASPYRFATQFFKLGSGILTVIPRTFLTCALIPPIMAFVFNKTNKENEQLKFKKNNRNNKNLNLNFKGIYKKTGIYNKFINKLSNLFAKVFNSEKMQNFSKKYHDTSLAQHVFSTIDISAASLFMHFTNKNKDIKESRKKTLIYNAGISTGITIISGYLLNWILKKPTSAFIKAFEKANKNLPNLAKYKDGIKNAKAVFILGGMHYLITPFVATMMAEYMTNTKEHKYN